MGQGRELSSPSITPTDHSVCYHALISARGLGLVEGAVHTFEHLCNRFTWIDLQDPARKSHLQSRNTGKSGISNAFSQSLQCHETRVRRGCVIHQHEEFFPAPTANDIAFTECELRGPCKP